MSPVLKENPLVNDELFNMRKKKGGAVNIFIIHIMFDEKFKL